MKHKRRYINLRYVHEMGYLLVHLMNFTAKFLEKEGFKLSLINVLFIILKNILKKKEKKINRPHRMLDK